MNIKLKQLIADFTTNVRFANNYGDIDELAENIIEIGIVSPLMVEQIGDKYNVISGHRRFSALQKLLNEGKINEDYQVPCTVRTFASEIERSSLKLLTNDSQSLTPDEWMAEIARLVESIVNDGAKETEAIETVSKTMGKRFDYVKNAFTTWQAMDENAKSIIRSGKVGVTLASVLAKKAANNKLASIGVQFASEIQEDMKAKGVSASQEIIGQGIVNTQNIVIEKAKKGESIPENLIGEIAMQQILGLQKAAKKASEAKREVVVFEDTTPDFDKKALFELLQAIEQTANEQGKNEISALFSAIIKQCETGKLNPEQIISNYFKNNKKAA